MDMEQLIKKIEYMYKHNDGDNGYAVTDTFFNGYEAALLDVLGILEDMPSVLNGLSYGDMDEVEESFVQNKEYSFYARRIDTLLSLIGCGELYALIEHWYNTSFMTYQTLCELKSHVKYRCKNK